MFEGSCHCGQVRLSVPKPEYLNTCNCSMCVKLAGIWGYFAGDEIVLTGETVGYVRADMVEPYLATHHCPRCGATTHWQPLSPPPYARMGVNMRLFDEAARAGVELRYCDGRSWPLS